VEHNFLIMKSEFYDKLTKGGFKVIKSKIELPSSLLKRHKNLPQEYISFLESFESIINDSDTTWFLSVFDFNGKSNNEFKWNEFELLSLEWSEEDEEELNNITSFWNSHIPILMSVNNGFQFLAISLKDENHGEIVHGEEPVFEEVTKVCNNLNELIDLIGRKDEKLFDILN